MSVSYLNPKKSQKPKPTEHALPDFDSFVAVDLETTGLSDKDEIIEFGAVRITKGNFLSHFSGLLITNGKGNFFNLTSSLIIIPPLPQSIVPENVFLLLFLL